MSHVTKEEKILTRLDGCKHEGQVGGFRAMDRVAVKLEQDLTRMKATVKSVIEPPNLYKIKYDCPR